MNSKIDKIKKIAEYLNFRIEVNFYKEYYISSLVKNDDIVVYNLFINYKQNTGKLTKHTIIKNEVKVIEICPAQSDIDVLYKGITEEFKHELREMKINKIIIIDKIKSIAEELDFEISKNSNRWLGLLKKDENIMYEIYMNFDNNTITFIKMKNILPVDITKCSPNTDFEFVYNTIVEEFKHELRNNKINKVLSL